jgi:hypothetical protein
MTQKARILRAFCACDPGGYFFCFGFFFSFFIDVPLDMRASSGPVFYRHETDCHLRKADRGAASFFSRRDGS